MSNKIENPAVSTLIGFITRSTILEPFFDTNDRTPSWDGNIFVYTAKDQENKKIEKIPVQIKGKSEVKKLENGKFSFSLDVIDIENYYNDGGIFIFLVEIIGFREDKIFFVSLPPSDLKSLLKEANEKEQETKTIHLDELDLSSHTPLENACREFLLHRKKQFSTIDKDIDISEIEKVTFYVFPNTQDIESELLNREVYVYGTKAGDEIEYFIGKKELTIRDQINKKISISGRVYANEYLVEKTKDGEQIQILPCLSINLKTNQITLSLGGSLSNQLTALDFIINLAEEKHFYVGDIKIDIDFPEGEIHLAEQKSTRQRLNYVKNLLEIFAIETSDLDMDQIDTAGELALNILISTMLFDKKYNTLPFEAGFNSIQIGNINLGVLVFKDANGIFSIHDLFGEVKDKNFIITDENDENVVKTSFYVPLQHDFLLNIDNLDLSIVIENIKSVDFSPEYGEWVTLFGLELIKAYDISKNEEFLDSATEIYDWLFKKDINIAINKINIYQIIRRQRQFTKDEKKALFELIETIRKKLKKEKDKAEISTLTQLLCAFSILLENKANAEMYFDELSTEDQTKFMEFPIYTLGQQLNIFE